MVIFAKLASSAVSVLLCGFLVRSNTAFASASARKYAAMLVGFWAALSVSSIIWDSVFVPAVLTGFIVGFLCHAAGQTDWKRTVFFGIAFGVLRLAASGTALLYSHYFQKTNPQCTVLVETVTLYATVVFASVFNEYWSRTPMPLLQLIPIWLIAVVLCVEAIRNSGDQEVIILEVISCIWLLYAGLHLIHTGNRMEAGIRKYMQAQEKARHYVLREEYYQQLLEKQTETRALWHDLNKYLRAAKAETPSAQALEQLEAMLDSATEMIDTGNQVLNVILNEYAQSAKAAGIELRLKAQVPEKIHVSAADLYVLIGNTMDNAIEACQELPISQRLIDLTLRMHHDMLYYKIVNPYDTALSHRAPEPMRGHGLANVRRCVENYGGSMDVLEENGFFTVMAHLNIDTNRQT